MALTCKNCGGNISLNTNMLVCDSCGAQQALTDFLKNVSDNSIYNTDEFTTNARNTYKKALSLMAAARTESSFLFAAGVFEEIPTVLNAGVLAQECRVKANLLKSERIYNEAVTDMQSDNPHELERAIRAFGLLGEYKDAAAKKEECTALLSVAQIEWQEKLKKEEQQKTKEDAQAKAKAFKRKIRTRFIAVVLVLITVGAVIGTSFSYSPKHLKIEITPDAENFITEKYNDYVFHYIVKVKNNGLLDVRAIEGTVVFEKDNEVLVDTNISFSNYSSAVVRAKKSSKFTWELTVYPENTALALYETNFNDLKVKVDITGITYTNGKRKKY